VRSTIARPIDESEWLAIRHHYWNASDTAALFGEHPFTTLADVAVRKITRTTDAANQAMRRGQHLEQAIAEWWSDDAGVIVYSPTELYVYDDLVMATLDRGIYGSVSDALEIKTTNRHITEVERYWWWQTQAQCLCADLERVHLAALDASLDLKTFVIEADMWAMSLIAELAGKAMDYIRRGEIPPEAELEYRHFEKLHPRAITTSVDLDDDVAQAVAELGRIRNDKRVLDADEEAVKATIAAVLGDAASGMWEGTEIVTWRSVTRHNLDANRLRKEQPDIHHQYLLESSYRAMRVIAQPNKEQS
jgi:predicted phage-related endonuclease